MSQDSLNDSKPAKKFLKKGEGLKRFAAFKPPLPVTGHKPRRETFVKFKLDNNLYSDLLDNDSINLSMEIPKIPPPKIMHTPIRPRLHATGALRPIPFNVPNEADELPSPPRANVATKQSFKGRSQKQKDRGPNEIVEPKRYNLRGSRKQETIAHQKDSKKVSQRRIKAVVERHICDPPLEVCSPEAQVSSESQINGELDYLLQKIEDRKSSLDLQAEEEDFSSGDANNAEFIVKAYNKTPTHVISKKFNRATDLSTPTPGNCLLALGRQIHQIEANINELKERTKHCKCGALVSPKQQAPTTRSTRKTATQPKTNADSTPRLLSTLMDSIAQLNKRLDEMNFEQ